MTEQALSEEDVASDVNVAPVPEGGAADEAVADDQAPLVEETSTEAADLAGFEGLSAPNGEADDLKKIDGVGPVIEKKLNDLGIYHFSQIAELSKDQADAIDNAIAFKGRIERDDWLGQAKKLMGE